ncbi:Hypothetical predicted protein [Pelobates cultripes]|uniref:Uncharacterized protein n=1 Tax=Pelobates cultripes TaxID=61616 RepID=A0AAD1W1A6_PELCU|nr:Hypothetical predicted protein [Pelobates cultripes]
MAYQPMPGKRSTHIKTHMSPMETFDQLCAGLKESLHSRGATHHQAELTVALWIRPAARRSYYMQVPRASKMAIRQNRYCRALRPGHQTTRAHAPTSIQAAPGLRTKRRTHISHPSETPVTSATRSTSPHSKQHCKRLRGCTTWGELPEQTAKAETLGPAAAMTGLVDTGRDLPTLGIG